MLSLFNEIKIMRGIKDHPNLIKFEEAFEGENTFYLVMEIVEGTSLYDEIKMHASIPYKGYEIATIIRLILEAVNYPSSPQDNADADATLRLAFPTHSDAILTGCLPNSI